MEAAQVFSKEHLELAKFKKINECFIIKNNNFTLTNTLFVFSTNLIGTLKYICVDVK